MKPRNYHAAGIITDLVTDEQLVAVTGGWSCDILTSTEILQNGEWVQGKIEKSILHTYIKALRYILGCAIKDLGLFSKVLATLELR